MGSAGRTGLMGLILKIKEFALRRVIYAALVRLRRRIVFENIPELLKKKTTWVALLGIVVTLLGAFGQQELADKAREGVEAVQSPGWTDDLKWLAMFATAIFMRLGILKGK